MFTYIERKKKKGAPRHAQSTRVLYKKTLGPLLFLRHIRYEDSFTTIDDPQYIWHLNITAIQPMRPISSLEVHHRQNMCSCIFCMQNSVLQQSQTP